MRKDSNGDGLTFDADALRAPREREYVALCEGCHFTMPEAVYTEAEKAVGPFEDPPCPQCGRRVWTFHGWPE